MRLPGAVWPSLALPTKTGAPAGLPCCREIGAAGVNTGAELVTLRLKLASVVEPQLSVARMVIEWMPIGAALVRVIAPLVATLIPPV